MVLAFLLATMILTGVAFGLAPAFEAFNRKVGTTLKDESRGTSGGVRTRLRRALVIAEIAFSLVLLVGAGLMLKSLTALLDHNPGFDTRRLLTFSVFLPPVRYFKDPDIVRFDRDFMDRMRVLPGFVGVASTSVVRSRAAATRSVSRLKAIPRPWDRRTNAISAMFPPDTFP